MGRGSHRNREERLESADSGIFTWDLETNVVQADTAVAELFGLDAEEVLSGLPIEKFMDRIHPKDRPKVAQAIHHAVVSGDPYHELYTTLGKTGTHDVVAFGRCFRGPSGAPKHYAGIVFKAADRSADADPIIAHIAMAHKIAVETGRMQIADALQAILEDLPRKERLAGTQH
jgi:PAS domain S-box-containing protein